jgi:hypothetical protein
MRERVSARSLDFLDHSIRCIIALDVIHDYVGARLAKRHRDALTDAGIGACNEGFLASQKSWGWHRVRLLFDEDMVACISGATILQRARTPIGPMTLLNGSKADIGKEISHWLTREA